MVSIRTDKYNNNQTESVQVNIWVREGITKGGVDNHKQDTTANRTKWRFLPFQPVLDVPPHNLQKKSQQVAFFSVHSKSKHGRHKVNLTAERHKEK